MSHGGYHRWRRRPSGPQQYYQLRSTARRRQPYRFSPADNVTLGPIYDPDNLIAVMRHMAANNGEAPGPDGIRLRDLGRSERAELARVVSHAVLSGRYRPGDVRKVDIGKPDGGTRTLTIGNLADRLVAVALTIAITPVLDASWMDCSYGFRPNRNIHQMLAELEASVVLDGRTWIVNDDIRKAFDFVPIDRAVDAIQEHIPDTGTVRLIDAILRGGAPEKTAGIPQGCALSPAALNTMLTTHLDRPTETVCPETPYWRYADNLVGAATCATEGRKLTYQLSTSLGKIGMVFKHQSEPVDLRRLGAHVDLLGYRVRMGDEGQINYELLPEEWNELEEQVRGTHKTPRPGRKTKEIFKGWIVTHGPVLRDAEKRRDVIGRIRQIAKIVGIREIGPVGDLEAIAGRAAHEWETMRENAVQRRKGVQGRSGVKRDAPQPATRHCLPEHLLDVQQTRSRVADSPLPDSRAAEADPVALPPGSAHTLHTVALGVAPGAAVLAVVARIPRIEEIMSQVDFRPRHKHTNRPRAPPTANCDI